MKYQNPLVTVYITNYNYGAYIEQSIESVLIQSFQDFELLIIDDGSTDNSKDIIEKYRSLEKVQIIYQQNKGLNITNNIAMRAARGKYLMRLDADDFLENAALELMTEVLEQNSDIGLIFPDYYYVNAEGQRIGEERRHNFEKEVSLYDQPAHGACTMIRLEFLKNLGGYNESFTCQDGYDLWIKFIMHHKVININTPLFSYRRHGNNLTTDENRILKTRKKIKELFVEEHLKMPNVLTVIPVRNTFIRNINWPLQEIEGKSVLERKIDVCLKAKRLSTIVISSSDQEILNYSRKKFSDNKRILILERPKAFSAPDQTLAATVTQAVNFVHLQRPQVVDVIISLSIDYPFVESDVIDDAVNTLVLFKADTVLSVRPDNKMYYQHNGHSLKPILDQEKFTKLEREALYKGAGGIMVSTRKSFEKNNRLISGKISHIVVDQKTSFGVFGNFDFEIYNTYFSKFKD